MAEMIVISDLQTLQHWRAAIDRAFFTSIVPPAQFDLPNLDETGNRHLTREAARLHRACGCTAAGFAMTAALLAAAVSIVLDPRGAAALPASSWAGYVLMVVLSAAAGKLAGQLWARRQMVHLAGWAETLVRSGEGPGAR